MKILLLTAWTGALLAVGCKSEPAPGSAPPSGAKTAETAAAPATETATETAAAPAAAPAPQEPQCCCAAKAFVDENGNVQHEMMPAKTCTEDFGGTCEPASTCAAAAAAPATAPPATAPPAPTAAAPAGSSKLDVSRAVKPLSEIVGTTVGVKGAIAMPECCLDCDALVPELQKLASLPVDLGAPAGATELRAASTKVRAAPWATLLEATAYDEKTRATFVTRMESLASELETAANALDSASDPAPHAKQIATRVEHVIASARALGKASRAYCAHD